MAKIKLQVGATIEKAFKDFLLSRKTKGLAEKTLQSYQSQFQAVARHLDVKMDISMLQKADLDAMIIRMRDAGLSPNSINSYTRTLKSFFSWCNEQGITRLNIPLYKAEETVKETYSDAELAALLKKPDIRKATFAIYRDWVIINFLLNCGSRAATVRAIQIRDVDLDGGMVFYRHTKNRKAQVIPLCSAMIAIAIRDTSSARPWHDSISQLSPPTLIKELETLILEFGSLDKSALKQPESLAIISRIFDLGKQCIGSDSCPFLLGLFMSALGEGTIAQEISKGDNYYYADNADGWHISLRYEGNNVMSIDIDAPDEEEPDDSS